MPNAQPHSRRRAKAGSLAFQTFTREDGDIGVRVVSANNEVLMSSEGYRNRQDAVDLIQLLREKLPNAELHTL